MDTQIEKSVKKLTKQIVDKKMQNFITHDLPLQVIKNMNEEVPTYLNNNVQMQNILQHHSNNLNQQLYASASQTLNKLTNEEQYHYVTNSHLTNMNNRFNNKLESFELEFSGRMAKMQEQVNREISYVKECNDKFDKLVKENLYIKLALCALFIIMMAFMYIFNLSKV
ncbi:hypothetical protein Catovirus_1_691 [Catovirus CTV1]|uniref:Uncharacterized protein n=1 Tax=Catovirus CTV1 TaxID=1977631 RepID=A0A1V0SAC6_9VIRU|nr:hypothetical protein Catovirus_1_691 [Catovirus CTV1]